MMNLWTNEDIEAIMLQLNNQNLPFRKYEFSLLGEGMNLLGSGASAHVYEAVLKGKKTKKFAIKVIGFGNKHVDSDAFRCSVQAQIKLGHAENDIVTIYDSIELRVWIKGENEVEKVEEYDPYEKAKPDGNWLHLQFILMEKVHPVLISHRLEHKLFPGKLKEFDEKEIMKLAYEIGMAINKAHKKNLIHRDIKLENIFYDSKRQHYKLGDFGIARTTDDGMASTVAFTKGYGAPEVVGTLDDKYDYTADIYSFGMMLYVLLNELRFPESNDYHPTVFQYIQGYIPPEPVNGSDELVSIVLRMLSFDPDERYQTMEEVLNEFDKLKFGHQMKYRREYKSTAFILGSVFALMGSAVWKLSFLPDARMDFSIWMYVLCTMCVGQTVLHVLRKKTRIIRMGIFALGTYLMISTGFTWWKLILMMVLVFCYHLSGIIGGCALIANGTFLIMKANGLYVCDYAEYRWTAVLLLSLAFVLLALHSLLGERDEMITKFVFVKNLFWIDVIAWYLVLAFMDNSVTITQGMPDKIYIVMLGQGTVKWMKTWNPRLVGIGGVIFCIIWVAREYFLSFIEKRREDIRK